MRTEFTVGTLAGADDSADASKCPIGLIRLSDLGGFVSILASIPGLIPGNPACPMPPEIFQDFWDPFKNAQSCGGLPVEFLTRVGGIHCPRTIDIFHHPGPFVRWTSTQAAKVVS